MADLLDAMRIWVNTPLPKELWHWLEVARFFLFLNTVLAVGFMLLRWTQMRHIWHIWLVVIPSLGVSSYLFVQLFLAEELHVTPTNGIMYFDVCLALTYLAASVVITKLYVVEQARLRAEKRVERVSQVLEGRRG
jgi:hypothetical protein